MAFHKTNDLRKVANQDQMPSADAVPLIEFTTMPWETPAVGVRVKQVDRGDRRIRLIEISEDFVETDWCRTGHVGFVIDGQLAIDFGSRTVELSAGDGLFIPAGESSKHKASVPHGKATLFVVEHLERDGSSAHHSTAKRISDDRSCSDWP